MRCSPTQSVLAFAGIIVAGIAIGHPRAQTNAPIANQKPLAFDVAAIKPNTTVDESGGSYVEPGGRYTAKNATLRLLIKTAYGVHDSQIVGGPGWIGSDRWDITAKADGYAQSAPFRDTARLMLRPLLADRFKLTLRRAQRKLPVYALVLAKPNGEFGPQFRRNDEHECAGPVPPVQPTAGAKEDAIPLPCGADMFRPGHLAARAMILGNLLVALTRTNIGRPVIDRTGLTGKFDWDIQWTPDMLTVGNVTPIDGPSVFDAFREQAGLRLEPRKESIDVRSHPAPPADPAVLPAVR